MLKVLILTFWISSLLRSAGTDAAGAGLAHARTAARMIPSFELTDQYGNLRVVHFPTAKLMVVAVADREGAAEVDGWVHPIVARFGKSSEIVGIAQMSSVPGFLRNLVRKRFAETRSYPVLLDWRGEVSRSFGVTPGHTTVYVLEQSGRVYWQGSGEATDAKVQKLILAIEAVSKTTGLTGARRPSATISAPPANSGLSPFQ